MRQRMATLTQQFPYMEHKGTLTIEDKTFNVSLREIVIEEEIIEKPVYVGGNNNIYAYRKAFEGKRIFIVEEIES